VSSAPRILLVAFARSDAFRREYESNLANGGVFVATGESFELREKVRVKLVLGFCRREIELAGEVVHRVTREMGALGGSPGVAISFDEPRTTSRARPARRRAWPCASRPRRKRWPATRAT
jgi:Tfp pilus assembly protein PilZ